MEKFRKVSKIREKDVFENRESNKITNLIVIIKLSMKMRKFERTRSIKGVFILHSRSCELKNSTRVRDTKKTRSFPLILACYFFLLLTRARELNMDAIKKSPSTLNQRIRKPKVGYQRTTRFGRLTKRDLWIITFPLFVFIFSIYIFFKFYLKLAKYLPVFPHQTLIDLSKDAEAKYRVSGEKAT